MVANDRNPEVLLTEIAEAAALLHLHAVRGYILPTQLALIRSAVKTLRLTVEIGNVPEGEGGTQN